MSFLRKPNFILGLYLSVFEFAVFNRCSGNEKRCFPVQDEVVCYFLPNNTVGGLVWEEAWKICKDNNATLPVITNKVYQKNLEEYLESEKFGYYVWTSARESRNVKWTWLNGRPFSKWISILGNYDYDVHAVVNPTANSPSYIAAYPYNGNSPYVCQYSGERCQSNETIILKRGCLLQNDKTALNLYGARNRCFEDGGDLAVFDDNEDPIVFSNLTSWFGKSVKLWVGLRKQFWTWNKTSDVTEEMVYSNWVEREGAFLQAECMIVENPTRKWKQVRCSSRQRFICQTIETNSVTISPEKPTEGRKENSEGSKGILWVIVGSLLGVAVVLIIVVAILVLIKKRNGKSRKTKAAPAYETVEEHKSKQPIKTKEIESYQELQEHYAEIVEGHKPTPPAQTKEVTPRSDVQEHYAEITRKAGNKGGGGGKENETVDKVYGGGGGGIVYAKIEFQRQDPEGSPDAVEYSLPEESSSNLDHPQAKTNKNRGSSIEFPSSPQFPEHSIYANTGEQ